MRFGALRCLLGEWYFKLGEYVDLDHLCFSTYICFSTCLQRENFQIEGPTGVMKQLQALWHILELTDREIFAHLSNIGAESLHFAFPMLLVLFRRELSFGEALRMWEVRACNLI